MKRHVIAFATTAILVVGSVLTIFAPAASAAPAHGTPSVRQTAASQMPYGQVGCSWHLAAYKIVWGGHNGISSDLKMETDIYASYRSWPSGYCGQWYDQVCATPTDDTYSLNIHFDQWWQVDGNYNGGNTGYRWFYPGPYQTVCTYSGTQNAVSEVIVSAEFVDSAANIIGEYAVGAAL